MLFNDAMMYMTLFNIFLKQRSQQSRWQVWTRRQTVCIPDTFLYSADLCCLFFQGLSHLFQDSWCNARTIYIDLSFFSFLASLPTLRSCLLALRVAQYGGTQWTTFERIFDINCCFSRWPCCKPSYGNGDLNLGSVRHRISTLQWLQYITLFSQSPSAMRLRFFWCLSINWWPSWWNFPFSRPNANKHVWHRLLAWLMTVELTFVISCNYGHVDMLATGCMDLTLSTLF